MNKLYYLIKLKLILMKFNQLSIDESLAKGIPFDEMTPIQEETIPIALKGKDVTAQAKTSSGKTISYLIPILNKIFIPDVSPQAIILTPTRELAIQVAKEAKKLSSKMKKVKILACYGGQPIGKQVRALNKGVHIVVGTPGRILDHIQRGTLNLIGVETAVLDEADEMLDMGFREDISEVLRYTPHKRQTLLFSATISKDVRKIAKAYQNNPKFIQTDLESETINEYYLEVDYRDKLDVLCRLIDIYDFKLVLVFCNTKKLVDLVKRDLKKRDIKADCLHGDMKQVVRDKVMNKFRNGALDVLVASDVAARGLDVRSVEAVINYDLPFNSDDYTHRVGRTARAGDVGYAFSFVEKDEHYTLNSIKKVSNITKMKVPSQKDVDLIRNKVFLNKIENIIKKEDLTKEKEILKNLDESPEDIAGALFKQIRYK